MFDTQHCAEYREDIKLEMRLQFRLGHILIHSVIASFLALVNWQLPLPIPLENSNEESLCVGSPKPCHSVEFRRPFFSISVSVL